MTRIFTIETLRSSNPKLVALFGVRHYDDAVNLRFLPPVWRRLMPPTFHHQRFRIRTSRKPFAGGLKVIYNHFGGDRVEGAECWLPCSRYMKKILGFDKGTFYARVTPIGKPVKNAA